MKKFILIFAILLGCGFLNAQAKGNKKKIYISPFPTNISQPTSVSGMPSSTLFAEYDEDSLTLSISDYWGDAEVYILSESTHALMDCAQEAVVFQAQMDFPLTGYTEGLTYQIIIVLDNGEVYSGEFQYM